MSRKLRNPICRGLRVAIFLCLLLSFASVGSLAACNCNDVPRLKDRLQKLQGIKVLASNKLKTVSADAPATRQDWDSFQALVTSYLQAMRSQNLTSVADASLLSHADPLCQPQASGAVDACLDQEFTLHQNAHDASCAAGKWNWQTNWTLKAMLQEELSAIEAEINFIQRTLDDLHCGACPQFAVVVQVVTTTAVNNSALREQSARSLNNGQGIPVPLVIHGDGSFEGFGSGGDSGAGMGVTQGEVVNTQFGHIQSITASGNIQSGTPQDIMHLVLIGGSSAQFTTAQARGQYNRDLRQVTPTGAATLTFDLPAYLGSSAQKTLLANSMINSIVQVKVVQASNGAPPLAPGASLLFSQLQCKMSTAAPATDQPPPSH